MKKVLCIMLVFLTVFCSTALARDVDQTAKNLTEAVRELEDYLQNKKENSTRLRSLSDFFYEIGSQDSNRLGLYCEVLMYLAEGRYGLAQAYLEMLISDKEAVNAMVGNIGSGFIPTAEVLKAYAEGRIAEAGGDMETAWQEYRKSMVFFDAMQRLKAAESTIQKSQYERAQAALEEQNYAAVVEILEQMSDLTYRNADKMLAYAKGELAKEPQPQTQPQKQKEARVKDWLTETGSIVLFGSYEQDNNSSNGKEPIEWIVLEYDAAQGRSLLISRYALDAGRFHNSTPYPTWEKSSIRAWLNDTFLREAFTAQEQADILETSISTPDYNGNRGGKDTVDKIWLLSREEMLTYFASDKDRQATPTRYAVARGADTSNSQRKNGVSCCWWWSRSPGYRAVCASYAYEEGYVNSYQPVNYAGIAIRPAMWISDSADAEETTEQMTLATAAPAPASTPRASQGKPASKATPKPTAKATAKATAKPTAAPTAKPTATATPRPTATPTAKPTATPKPASQTAATTAPTATPTPKPTATPTPKPTATPTPKPTATPTPKPTATPTPKPTATPTPTPTEEPCEIYISKSSWSPSAEGGTITVTFDYDSTYTISKSSSATWLHYSRSGTKITVTADENTTTKSRTGYIYVECDKHDEYARLKVTQAKGSGVVTPTGISLNKSSMDVILGLDAYEFTLKATVSPSGADQTVTWSSSNTSVATVSSSGFVSIKTMKTSNVTITATTSNGLSASCTIRVIMP